MTDRSNHLPATVRQAFRAMTTGRPGAVHLALPFDTQKAPVEISEIWADARHSIFPAERTAPETSTIRDATDILSEANNAVAICGGGPLLAQAEDTLSKIATLLYLPIASTVSGQGAIAEKHPQALVVIGSNGGVPATRSVINAADVILFIECRAGSVTTERWRSPPRGKTIIHIDSDPMVIGANYPTDVAICADARLALEALLAELETCHLTSQNGALRAAQAWEAKLAAFHPLATSAEHRIRPEAVIAALMETAQPAAIIVADPGTPCPYVSAHYRRPQPAHHVDCLFKRGLWLDQGGSGPWLWQTLLQRRFQPNRPRRCRARLWCQKLDGRGSCQLIPTLKEALAHPGPTLIDVISQPLHEAATPVSEWVAQGARPMFILAKILAPQALTPVTSAVYAPLTRIIHRGEGV